MKCIKNEKTGNIIRVDDVQASQLVGNTWKYVPKSEWKLQNKVPVTEEIVEKQEQKEEAKNEKLARRTKLKSKQREADPLDKLLK